MKLRLLTLVAALALVAIVLLLRPWRDAHDAPLATPAPAARAMDVGPSTTDMGPLEVDADESVPLRVPPTTQRSVAEVAQPEIGAWTIRVERRGSGEVVPNAVVSLAPGAGANLLPDPNRPFLRLDPESLLPVDAPKYTSDASGTVLLPESRLPLLVVARAGDEMGWISVWEPPTQPIVLRIARERDVRIQVVDAAGTPVLGVPVLIRSLSNVNGGEWRGTTAGPEGIAHARHLQRDLATAANTMPTDVVAYLPITSRELILAPVDLEHPAAEPIRLVLPPYGSATVKVRHSDGTPAHADLIQLTHVGKLNKGGKLGWTAPEFEPVLVEDGTAHYPFVETGLELFAEARTGVTFVSTRAPGPMRAGAHVVLELDVGRPAVRIAGRILRADGTPLANTYVGGSLRIEGPRITSSTAGPQTFGKSDAEGRFEHALPFSDPTDTRVALNIQVPTVDAAGVDRIDLVLDGRLREGYNELGDLVARPPEILFSGRVVDANGAPLAQAQLGIEIVTTRNGRETWTAAPQAHTKPTGADGSFRILGPAITERVRLSAWLPDYVQVQPCTPKMGATDVVLVLERASEIEGKVLLDDPQQANRLRVLIARPNASDEVRVMTRMQEMRHVQPDGTFRLNGLRPGVVDVEVRVNGVSTPILTLRGVDLRSPGRSNDPRLAEVDLRGLVPPEAKPKDR